MSKVVQNSTYRFKLTASKDGSPWDITGATVTLYMRKPKGELLTYDATANISTTTTYVDVDDTQLDVVGVWYRSWRIELDTVDVESPAIRFLVLDKLST